MATIISEGLKFIINFVYLGQNEFFQYDMFFYWNDELIINKEILKNFSLKQKIDNGSFQTFEYDGGERLINTIKTALNNKSAYWQPLSDPTIILAFYPNRFFPFIKPDYEIIKSDPEIEKEIKLTTDENDFSMIIFIETFHFKNMSMCNTFCQQGVSLTLVLDRNKLTEFLNDLETEYKQFCIDNKFKPMF